MIVPGSISPLLLGGGNYQIPRSLRFNSADSAYLARTPGGAGNRKTWTFSCWAKIAKIPESATGYIFLAYTDASNSEGIAVDTDSTLYYYCNIGGSTDAQKASTMKMRDPTAWFHLVVQKVAASGTLRMWVNNVEVTSWGTNNEPGNSDGSIGNNVTHYIGGNNSGARFNGYLADVVLVDGSALTPSSFGKTDAQTGQWVPIRYAGSLGTNGFYLDFRDNASTTTLGYDAVGSNDWTTSGFSVTAGAGNDSLTDTPTNNYCTLSPVVASAANIANGNLDSGTTAVRGSQNAILFDSYWEVAAGGSNVTAGVISEGGTASTTTVTANKTFGFRLTTAGALDYINITDAGAWTSIATGLTDARFPYGTTAAASWNFGQRAFAGTKPTGFKALCTANLPVPTIKKANKYFDVNTRTGTGATASVTGKLFQPDLVWIKSRSAATDHSVYDAVRGAQARLETNQTDDEATTDGGLTAFNSDGFSLSTLAQVNTNAATYVDWLWKESAASGVDIVSYTGNGSNRTINHNLGVTPEMMIVKARTTAGTNMGWAVYHKSVAADPQTDYLLLNGTAAAADDNTYWNDTAPTSSVFSVGTAAAVNTNNDTYIAYLFASVAGFSRVGSYVGNGSADGPFVWCGFRPKWVMVKNASAGSTDWAMMDADRAGRNVDNDAVYANLANAEATTDLIDILANGFKVRSTASGVNGSTNTIVFLAFAEAPFKFANAR